MKHLNRSRHVTRGSALDDLGLPRDKAQALKVKADLHYAMLRVIARRRLSRKQLAQVLDEPPSRVSELLLGRISSVSIERLLRYAARLGVTAKIRLTQAPAA